MNGIGSVAELNGYTALATAIDEFDNILCPYEDELRDVTEYSYTFMQWIEGGEYGLTKDGHWFNEDGYISKQL